jgi:hypothetical protein
MNKEFVTYEQALALKELGFDEPCLVVWPGIEGQKLGYDGRYFSLVKGYKNSKLSKEVKKYAPGIIDVAAPLYQQAFRWFREKYELHSFIYSDYTWNISGGIWDIAEHKGVRYDWDSPEKFSSYEEAQLDCLTKLIAIVQENEAVKSRS